MEDEIRKLFEQLDPEGKIDQDRINGFIEAVKEMQQNPPKDGDRIGDAYVSILREKENQLKKEISEEPDWRKRASLAAQIISNNLE